MSKRVPVSVLICGLIALTACSAGSSGAVRSSAGSMTAASPTGTTSAKTAATTPTDSTTAAASRGRGTSRGGTTASGVGIHKIKHVIIIMQENRSFDSYFGTFPGADGIKMKHGKPTVCLADPVYGGCQRPYPDHADENFGGGHFEPDVPAAVDGGKMDGFLSESENAGYCKNRTRSACDIMGYHTGSDIPNYWSYAKNFVLQDHMFEPVASWSVPSHLYLISGWAALCPRPGDPMSCRSYMDYANAQRYPYAWTDLTYLLHKNHVTWGWYLDHSDGAGVAIRASDKEAVGYFNVLPGFTDVAADHQLGNIRSQTAFFTAARNGRLPSVSWLIPDLADSEHPSYLVSTGQSYVTRLINAVMRSPNWDSSAIFIAWDDWGGFYDHVLPPKVDSQGYGLRVPGVLISPYAKTGYIDHQTLSFDAYLKFIEDDFLGGQRLNPKTDGRPDPRPGVRENSPILGDLRKEFDFSQQPRPPLILPVCPTTTLTGVPNPGPYCS